jgi:hypothetical protein
MKATSLGSAASAVAGLLITNGTNATPIVATVTAGHGLKNGDRIAISGVTGLTSMNGIWTVGSVGATSATLIGSAGNGAFGGTAVVGRVFDTSPFMQGTTAVLMLTSAAFVGTFKISAYANYTDFANADNETGGAAIPVKDFAGGGANAWTHAAGSTSAPASSTLVATVALPVISTEVQLSYIMVAEASAYTSGNLHVRLLA